MRPDLKWSVEFAFFHIWDLNVLPIFEHLPNCLLPIWEPYANIVSPVCKLPEL